MVLSSVVQIIQGHGPQAKRQEIGTFWLVFNMTPWATPKFTPENRKSRGEAQLRWMKWSSSHSVHTQTPENKQTSKVNYHQKTNVQRGGRAGGSSSALDGHPYLFHCSLVFWKPSSDPGNSIFHAMHLSSLRVHATQVNHVLIITRVGFLESLERAIRGRHGGEGGQRLKCNLLCKGRASQNIICLGFTVGVTGILKRGRVPISPKGGSCILCTVFVGFSKASG